MANPVKFTLEIDMGNEAMKFKRHASKALADTSNKIMLWAIPCNADTGSVFDENGDQVGEWQFHYGQDS